MSNKRKIKLTLTSCMKNYLDLLLTTPLYLDLAELPMIKHLSYHRRRHVDFFLGSVKPIRDRCHFYKMSL